MGAGSPPPGRRDYIQAPFAASLARRPWASRITVQERDWEGVCQHSQAQMGTHSQGK